MNENPILELAKTAWEKTFEYNPCDQWKNWLYWLTMVVQLLAAAARWALAYAVLWVLGLDLFIGRGNAAVLFGIFPLLWSFSAFWFPGTGYLWHRMHGAREPSESELDRYHEILDKLGDKAWEAAKSIEMVVVDHLDHIALGRGVSYFISRGLLEHRAARMVTAHELYHFDSGAARLSQALERLVWWRDPYRRLSELAEGRGEVVRSVYFLWRWFFRIAGGGLFLEYGPLQWLWASSYRKEEYAADEFAVDLGQGMALASYLQKYELPRARPRHRRWIDKTLHPFMRYRIDALRRKAKEARERLAKEAEEAREAEEIQAALEVQEAYEVEEAQEVREAQEAREAGVETT